MRFKWKAGLNLLFLLVSFIIYTYTSETNSWGMQSDEKYTYLVFLIIYSLLATLVFLASLYFFSKRIKENNFSYIKVILYDLVLFVVILFLEILFVFFLPEFAEFILVWVYILMIMVFSIIVFSFLPVVVYYKIHGNQSLIRKISISTVIIGILIIIYSIVISVTCSLGTSMKCISQKAFYDINICEEQKTDFNKCRCYSSTIDYGGYSGNIEVCDRYKELNAYCSEAYNRCVTYMASNSNNVALCDHIDQMEGGWSKDVCVARFKDD